MNLGLANMNLGLANMNLGPANMNLGPANMDLRIPKMLKTLRKRGVGHVGAHHGRVADPTTR